MRRVLAVLCFGLIATFGIAQDDQAAKANDLFKHAKLLDALPLYDDLAKANPKEQVYFTRLADCLNAQITQTDDPATIKALRLRMRDAARHAMELGEVSRYIQIMAAIDVNAPIEQVSTGPGTEFFKAAEKAYGAGDYADALAKYAQAADANPKLYEAPLYAGDMAFRLKDLPNAAKWFARAIAVDPDRETAYRYWGDAILHYGADPAAAKEKFIDALIAEPYKKLSWQGIENWAQIEKAVILAPKINRPPGPAVNPDKPNNINITIDPTSTDDKKHPGSSGWVMYSMIRASYQMEEFKKDFPNEKQYRHTLKEEDSALSIVASTVADKKIKPNKLDESLRNLVELNQAGMLDCWILINGADQGVAQDYDAYRKDHRQLLHDYFEKFVIHGGINPPKE